MDKKLKKQRIAKKNTEDFKNKFSKSVFSKLPFKNITIINKKDQIVEIIHSTASISEENSASSEEIAASTQEVTLSAESLANTAQLLADTSNNLIEQVNNFKLKEDMYKEVLYYEKMVAR